MDSFSPYLEAHLHPTIFHLYFENSLFLILILLNFRSVALGIGESDIHLP